MQKEKLLKLGEMLSCNAPEEKIQAFCRTAIESEFDSASGKKSSVSGITGLIHIPVAVRQPVPAHRQKESSIQSVYLLLLLCAGIYLVVSLICKPDFISWIIATLAVFISVYLLKRRESGKKVPEVETVSYRSAEDIAADIDNVVKYIDELMKQDCDKTDFPMETNPYLPMLRQIYNSAVETKDDFEKEKLTWLLENSGYEMIEYSEENEDMFERYESRIRQVTTTVKALINKKTRLCVFKGTVVFPLDGDN